MTKRMQLAVLMGLMIFSYLAGAANRGEVLGAGQPKPEWWRGMEKYWMINPVNSDEIVNANPGIVNIKRLKINYVGGEGVFSVDCNENNLGEFGLTHGYTELPDPINEIPGGYYHSDNMVVCLRNSPDGVPGWSPMN